jgi:hypothetical protein
VGVLLKTAYCILTMAYIWSRLPQKSLNQLRSAKFDAQILHLTYERAKNTNINIDRWDCDDFQNIYIYKIIALIDAPLFSSVV